MTTVHEGPPSALISRFLHFARLDRAVGWSTAARFWSLLTGPITLLLIASRLTPDEQGFYYTFTSVIALQVFFELGLTFVVQQFASHEKAFLEWQPDGTLAGNAEARQRLGTLTRKALAWYGVAALLLALALIIGGSIFLSLRDATVSDWQVPWIAVSLIAAAALVTNLLFAILDGCGAIADVARVKVLMAAAGNVAVWTVLLMGGRLYAAVALWGAWFLVGVIWLFVSRRRFFLDLLRTEGSNLSWRDEVWPFQWRIAVSWISGYFIFQLFTPLLFASRGPAEAGRMGMSFAIVTVMSGVSMVWLSTKMPAFGECIARRDFAALDALFFPNLWRSFFVMFAGSAAFFAAVLVLRANGHAWSTRVLDPLPLALLLLASLANHIVYGESLYLRAHKQEPFLIPSVVNALLVGTTSFVLVRLHGATGMLAGFFVITMCVSLGWGTWIFVTKRRAWHE